VADTDWVSCTVAGVEHSISATISCRHTVVAVKLLFPRMYSFYRL
jgi:hypothetical protein